MELNEYQRLAKETAVYDHERDSITYPILGLCNETGEVAGKLKKWKRGDYNDFSKDLILKMIADELGDVFWYLAATADDLGYTFSSTITFFISNVISPLVINTLSNSPLYRVF